VTLRPCATSQITWKCRTVVSLRLDRSRLLLINAEIPRHLNHACPVIVVEQSLPNSIPLGIQQLRESITRSPYERLNDCEIARRGFLESAGPDPGGRTPEILELDEALRPRRN
jgi:hypothetical protein